MFSNDFDDDGNVAFVDDGVNDAAALSSATVYIAVGTGSAIAAKSAGVSLVGYSILDEFTTIDVAHCAIRRNRRNFVRPLGFNAVGMPLPTDMLHTCMHFRIPPFSAAADTAASLASVVVCALTLARYKRRVADDGGDFE